VTLSTFKAGRVPISERQMRCVARSDGVTMTRPPHTKRLQTPELSIRTSAAKVVTTPQP
jgi:hypothetical protein